MITPVEQNTPSNWNMAWSSKKGLKLVSDQEATGKTAEIFAEMRFMLGLPFTPAYYQALAYAPCFLEIYWLSVLPVVRTAEFFRAADRIRGETYTAVHNYLEVPDLCRAIRETNFSEGAQRELSAVIQHFFYRDGVLLLLCAMLSLALEGGMEAPAAKMKAAEALSGPPAPPETTPLLVPEESATPATRAIFAEIRRTLKLPVQMNDYSAIARWPDFLCEYWKALRPNAVSPIFGEYRVRIAGSAQALAADLPSLPALSLQFLEDSGIKRDDLTSLAHINEAFFDAFSANLISITFAQIGLEGGNGRDHGRRVA